MTINYQIGIARPGERRLAVVASPIDIVVSNVQAVHNSQTNREVEITSTSRRLSPEIEARNTIILTLHLVIITLTIGFAVLLRLDELSNALDGLSYEMGLLVFSAALTLFIIEPILDAERDFWDRFFYGAIFLAMLCELFLVVKIVL